MSDGLPSAGQQELIEEFGLVFEANGMPRMAGRVLGRLLMCWPPHQSMTQLAEALQASKASISTTTAMLAQMGFVERLSFPGDRQDYFRVRPTSTAIHVQDMARRLRAQLALVERGDGGGRRPDPRRGWRAWSRHATSSVSWRSNCQRSSSGGNRLGPRPPRPLNNET